MSYTTYQLDVMIKDAEEAYAKLIMGRAARVIVDGANGERVEFVPADKPRLYQYIQDLKSQRASLISTPVIPSRAPAGFIF